jgi:hypothetical protein
MIGCFQCSLTIKFLKHTVVVPYESTTLIPMMWRRMRIPWKVINYRVRDNIRAGRLKRPQAAGSCWASRPLLLFFLFLLVVFFIYHGFAGFSSLFYDDRLILRRCYSRCHSVLQAKKNQSSYTSKINQSTLVFTHSLLTARSTSK